VDHPRLPTDDLVEVPVRLPRPRVRVTWDRQPPTDRFLGVAWGRHWSSYTWGFAVGFGPRAVTLHLPPPIVLRHRLRLWRWGFPPLEHQARLYDLADLLVTPDRYGDPITRLAARVERLGVDRRTRPDTFSRLLSAFQAEDDSYHARALQAVQEHGE
jgi:hypothetical protein